MKNAECHECHESPLEPYQSQSETNAYLCIWQVHTPKAMCAESADQWADQCRLCRTVLYLWCARVGIAFNANIMFQCWPECSGRRAWTCLDCLPLASIAWLSRLTDRYSTQYWLELRVAQQKHLLIDFSQLALCLPLSLSLCLCVSSKRSMPQLRLCSTLTALASTHNSTERLNAKPFSQIFIPIIALSFHSILIDGVIVIYSQLLSQVFQTLQTLRTLFTRQRLFRADLNLTLLEKWKPLFNSITSMNGLFGPHPGHCLNQNDLRLSERCLIFCLSHDVPWWAKHQVHPCQSPLHGLATHQLFRFNHRLHNDTKNHWLIDELKVKPLSNHTIIVS